MKQAINDSLGRDNAFIDSLLGYAAKTIKDNLTLSYLSLGSAGLVEPMEVRFLQGKIDGLKLCLDILRDGLQRMKKGLDEED